MNDFDYGGEQEVLVFAGSEAARTQGAGLVGASGYRVGQRFDLTDAVVRLDQAVRREHFILVAEEQDGAALDALLVRLNAIAADGRCAGSVVMPTAMIDRVTRTIADPAIDLLCEPSSADVIASLTMMATALRQRIGEQGEDNEIERLHALSEEVGRIARTLASLSKEGRTVTRARNGGHSAGWTNGQASAVTAEVIRRILRARRLRARYFDPELFADPAWDMLLDLSAARTEGRPVAVSSLCIAAAVPPTTALRWIRAMSDHGLFVRTADPQDGRRVFIELSDGAAKGMADYFATAQDQGLLVL
jgi:DNA-binding MarR family transcriptional regulator